MVVETFTASTAHGHIRGTVSADRHDIEDFADYLKRTGVLAAGDFVAGMELVSIPNGAKPGADVSVTAYVCDLAGRAALAEAVKAGPVHVRKVAVQMPLLTFFRLFKQLSIRMSPGGLLDGREVHIDA